MIEKALISFNGYPIFKIATGEILNEKELQFIKNFDYKTHYQNNTKLTKESNILNHIELSRVKSFIWEHFCWFIDNVIEIENDFYMCNSWSTIQTKGDNHINHLHPGAIFSSTFYAQLNKGGLYFSTNRSKIQEGFNFDYKIKNYNMFNSLSWLVPVKTGDLVIFPGELRHESQTHNGEEERIMIGSSYFVEGDLGEKAKYNNISIRNNNA